jgi:hypothetical protein
MKHFCTGTFHLKSKSGDLIRYIGLFNGVKLTDVRFLWYETRFL